MKDGFVSFFGHKEALRMNSHHPLRIEIVLRSGSQAEFAAAKGFRQDRLSRIINRTSSRTRASGGSSPCVWWCEAARFAARLWQWKIQRREV